MTPAHPVDRRVALSGFLGTPPFPVTPGITAAEFAVSTEHAQTSSLPCLSHLINVNAPPQTSLSVAFSSHF